MIVPSAHILASPVDTFWTKPVLKRAARVLFLTDKEREGLERLVPSALRLQHLPNGVPDLSGSNSPSEAVEVLFLARLHSRKRPLIFIEMAKKLHSHFPEARFTLVGPDEGEGSAVRSAIAASGMRGALHWEGSVEPQQSAARIGRSSIYVLPSIDEPFPMSVLEAMSLGKPVVITDSCGLAGAVSAASAGAVVGEDIESLTSAVATLLESPQHRNEAAENARKLVRDKFAMPEIVRQLTDLYQDVSQRHVS
jgi:glycosyltransferase involved in cell wall biosynthesis